MSWTIRQAGPAEAPTIVKYNLLLASESEGKTLDAAVLTAGVEAALADPTAKGPYYLVVEGDDVLGQLQITFEWSDWRNGWYWWIQSVYVRAEDRRRGVFRSLYHHVVDLARAAGVVGIRLYVERENHAAQRTYKELGMAAPAYLMLERQSSVSRDSPGRRRCGMMRDTFGRAKSCPRSSKKSRCWSPATS